MSLILKPTDFEEPATSLNIDIAAGVMTLTLNRPDKLNAINTELAQALLAALKRAAASSAVRVVVLRGAGRAFCAGRDLSEAPNDEVLHLVQEVAGALMQGQKPVVVAAHGWVVGAGLEWMLCADIVIAASGARFRLPEIELGVFVTGGISALLPRVVGLSRARGMLLLGEALSAELAERWGLVWSVVDDDRLAAETARIAQRLASFEPAAMGRFKRVLNELGADRFDVAIRLETQMHKEQQHGPR